MQKMILEMNFSMKLLTMTLAKTKNFRLFKMNKRALEFCIAIASQPNEILVFHLAFRV